MKPRKKTSLKPGFALVVTLTLMVLLSILALGLLSLSSVSLRAMGHDNTLAVARANARMAMFIAIGQLQMHAGPDQRVTATAELEGHDQNPQWTGAWKTGSGNENSQPVWLVSGISPNPATQLKEDNSALLSSTPGSDPTRKELRAPLVELKDDKTKSKYAYWIGDEGTRARVDIEKPEAIASNIAERTARSLSPEMPRLAHFDEQNSGAWANFATVDKQTLATMDTLGLALGAGSDFSKEELAHHYFNDLTTGGFGLPVNVRDGGMKTDLSLVFDTSMEANSSVLSSAIGATPKPASTGTYDATGGVTNPEKFFLDKLIPYSTNGGQSGPNWGSLWDYAKSWKNVSATNTIRHIKPEPRLETDLRQANWVPYRNATGASSSTSWDNDFQHTNSPLHPVISMVQLTFRVTAVESGTGTVDNPPVGKYYIPRLEVKPVIGIWNPYNVSINATNYLIDWAIPPYLRLAHDGYGTDVHEMWLRDYWKTGTTSTGGVTLPTENSQNGGFFKLLTGQVSFKPGEMKYFSINSPTPLAGKDATNTLVQSWGENGGFFVSILRSSKYRIPGTTKDLNKGDPLRVPAGANIWFGSILLQDTHNDGKGLEWGSGTKAHFSPSVISPNAASTWMTLKAAGGSDHIQRFTNFWNGGHDDTMGKNRSGFIPEHVRHSGLVTPPAQKKYKIDNLAAGDAGHLASWRFHTRTTTEGLPAYKDEEDDQGLRGLIDTNPRPLAINPRFDGSKVKSGGIEGWTMASNFVAAENPDPSLLGDFLGGARGLVAEGNSGGILNITPKYYGNFQGYGGSSNSDSGMKNVILFDVPRSPLVSVGQFQHAGLARYQNEPAYVIGNSYADIRIPSDTTSVNDFAGYSGLRLTDISYEVNQSVWDSVFFSTLGPDYVGNSGQSFDSGLSFADISSGLKQLPNPRMVFTPHTGDTSFSDIISGAGARAPEAIASRILVKGAFNVNSTSKEAWKAILSTMGGSEMPVINLAGGATTWTNPQGIRFNRFSYSGSKDPYEVSGGDNTAFWYGWRKLSDEQLDKLAEEIVVEIKERGPFRSMADFVNRDPEGNPQQQLKGSLQAALDRVANSQIPASFGPSATKPDDSQFPGQIADEEKQSAGYPGHILQGDVLQSLAPILQVRSDYFRIRAYGEASDKNGNVTKAWCEAYVQRHPEYVDAADKPEISFDELTSDANKEFGRNFRLVSFRWLSPSEI